MSFCKGGMPWNSSNDLDHLIVATQDQVNLIRYGSIGFNKLIQSSMHYLAHLLIQYASFALSLPQFNELDMLRPHMSPFSH